jgi:hypothetical protein
MGRVYALTVLVALLAVQMSVALHPGQNQQRLHALGVADANGCEGTATEDACIAVTGCAWCTSGAVGDFCATAEEAKRLPPAVFTCKASPTAALPQ